MDDVEKLAEIFKGLADPTRLRLVKLLNTRVLAEGEADECGPGPLCVNALAHRLGITQSAVSQHLRILKQAGLVRGERRGSFMHYSLDHAGLEQYKALFLEALGEKSALP
jgi:DNA-binding transcriptional ArsR family regulator